MAGCGVGVGANAYVQSQRQRYHRGEVEMHAMLAELRAENARLEALVESGRAVIAADRDRIAAVDAAYRARRIARDEGQRELAGVQANRDHLRRTLAALQEQARHWEHVAAAERRAGTATAALDAEIARLRGQVASLQQEVALMERQIAVSPVAG